MSPSLDPQLKRALADRIRYYNELGIFDFYRRDFYRREIAVQIQPEEREPLPRAKAAVAPLTQELVEISPSPNPALPIQPRDCAPFATTSATAPAAACLSRDASRSFSAWAIRARN